MKLSSQQRKKLWDALINAFPTKSLLEQLLSFELDRNLDAIAGGNNLQDIVFNLIKTADPNFQKLSEQKLIPSEFKSLIEEKLKSF